MTQKDFRTIGQHQLKMMDEIHRLCVENGLTYYIIGGTLLGAVRHKGFIPWDLDIDLAMPRPDYDRFKEICREQLAPSYSYLDHHSFRCYMCPHALISKNDTRIHAKYDHLNPKLMEVGIYLDVFPLDNAPDDEGLRNRQARQLQRLKKLKKCRLPYSYSRKKWKRFAHYVVSGLLSWISVPRLNDYQQKLMQKYRDQETQCICSMASQYAYKKQCMPREIYGKPTLLEFEGRHYYAPEQYTQYLTRLYGDYMQLPPEEKRQANLEVYASVEYF